MVPAYYDHAAIGCLFGLFLFLSQSGKIQPTKLVIFLLISQLFFEHLGFITAVAWFLFTLMDTSSESLGARLGRALPIFVGLGLVSVVLLFGVYSLLDWANNGGAYFVKEGAGVEALFLTYGNANQTVALRIGLQLMHHIAFGVMVGVGLHFLSHKYEPQRPETVSLQQRRTRAGVAIILAYIGALAIGYQVSGLSNELGRQIAPLCCFIVFAVAMSLRGRSGFRQEP